MWAFAASALIFSRSADAMRVLNLISFFIINDLSEMISLVPSESWGGKVGAGLPPENGVWGRAPPSAFGRAAASPQTRQMRCWPSPPPEWATILASRAMCGKQLSAGTHATPSPNLAHSGSHAETRRVLRVDGDDVSGSGIIDPIGPFQADQTVAVALAEGHRNAASP